MGQKKARYEFNNNNNNNNNNNLVTVENIDNKNYLEYWLPGY